ncbi:hypothetical protein TrCOL_g2741 [Triparma columacea]|uniref:Uncharacterized protein n=1 Tax=Triparma columacea TaxID=722753 RepID=A0A9W7GCF9_9STRA|nr:hypothetical protein TrCOL_g2741 [Triparma columacea]
MFLSQQSWMQKSKARNVAAKEKYLAEVALEEAEAEERRSKRSENTPTSYGPGEDLSEVDGGGDGWEGSMKDDGSGLVDFNENKVGKIITEEQGGEGGGLIL